MYYIISLPVVLVVVSGVGAVVLVSGEVSNSGISVGISNPGSSSPGIGVPMYGNREGISTGPYKFGLLKKVSRGPYPGISGTLSRVGPIS